MHPRRKARVGVLCGLYAAAIVNEDPVKILNDIYARESYDKTSKKFMHSLFMEAISQVDICDELINRHLKNWEFSRIALLDKQIMRMAITEMLFINDVPPKVAMSEAIEIAKEYSTAESSSFVNGILDAIYKESKLEKTTQAKAS
ncbi:MAG TPA: transcription antitermination factor NusB [Candidatus Marinimicrobia bacterium]|jgi:N utilization substance protein B|nr:transcription antitermination factor NusB [Candidatus Neomarinimicrobiota bacterium]MDP7217003.1 transcription antitermination factor NusB [Candidatus Neomarinimicrobiota bacterium]HBN45318.1 transcription antitermination factor NusB [Candidatus Neomarinimicrobiota bacterium]HJL74031.1 transcription antitermination factor NusB [Candidatus Neomarinimicrobiota bacterium]HJM69781.1 transcription antitermination factor NusB [Candidatus Neomarinimicrobiota bacterium]|tara:strand:+ start:232 stop:666 length:435 start_codon:yes stop_codon:yes gene_type:complete